MQKINVLAAVALIAFTFAPVSPARAEWTPRLECAGGLVVDGNYTFEHGFTAYQLVIRHSGAVAHFETLTAQKLVNRAGEIVVQMKPDQFGGRFDGSMRAPLGNFPVVPGGASRDVYELLGQWQDGGRYRVALTRVTYSPGASYRAPETLGDWVFEGCRTIR